MVDAFVLVAALASSRVTLQHEVWLEGDAPLTLGDLAKLEGDACRYHALEVPQKLPNDPLDLAFVIDLLDHCERLLVDMRQAPQKELGKFYQ